MSLALGLIPKDQISTLVLCRGVRMGMRREEDGVRDEVGAHSESQPDLPRLALSKSFSHHTGSC